jgi:uncharacterized phage protein (TIGR01671 family)
MREIKFRAWDIKGKRMIAFEDMFEFDPGNYQVSVDDHDGHALYYGKLPHTCELMQYTGLVDKNGKEVWEGDIVKYTEDGVYEDEERSTVVFENCGFWLDKHDNEYGYWPEAEDIEVIGNIYESPELIK